MSKITHKFEIRARLAREHTRGISAREFLNLFVINIVNNK